MSFLFGDKYDYKHPDSSRLAMIAGNIWISTAYKHLNCQGKVEVVQERARESGIFPGKLMRGWYKGERHMWLVSRNGEIIDPAQVDVKKENYKVDSLRMKTLGTKITKRTK